MTLKPCGQMLLLCCAIDPARHRVHETVAWRSPRVEGRRRHMGDTLVRSEPETPTGAS